MAFKPIETPRGFIRVDKIGRASLHWNPGCAARINKELMSRQELIDSEVLRLCSPYVPKDTGTLIKSGQLGTVIGSGMVQYIAPYARAQYYNTAESRSYDPRRGGRWFERMKAAHKGALLKIINEKG